MTGLIFDIKEFSVHDGPGTRVTVFMKGCPLRCRWCHNPEGLNNEKQLIYKKSFCTHCGRCFTKCQHDECQKFGRCLHACPNGCLSIAGREVTVEELAKEIEKFTDFISKGAGGITLSGGEPLMQPDFVIGLADRLLGIHKALQTSGFAGNEVYREVIGRFDYIMQDIKLADSVMHKEYTGVGNEAILENIEWLKKSGKDFVFRVPLIPDITDTPANLARIAGITEGFPVELLMYNKLAGAKYDMLDMKYVLDCAENEKDNYTSYFKNVVIKKL